MIKILMVCLFSLSLAYEKPPCYNPHILMGEHKQGRIISWQSPWTSEFWYRKIYMRNPSYGQWRERKAIWSNRHVYIEGPIMIGWEYKIVMCERTVYD